MRAAPPPAASSSASPSSATLPIAALLGVVVAATLAIFLIAQGNHEPPTSEVLVADLPLAILTSEEQDIDALPSDLLPLPAARLTATTTTRYLGTVDGQRYFVALRDDDHICLIAHGAASLVSGCRQIETFATSGQSLSFTGSETAVIALLLPDGYTNSATALPWATLVGENLLVVTEMPATAQLIRESLPANEPGDPTLELSVLASP